MCNFDHFPLLGNGSLNRRWRRTHKRAFLATDGNSQSGKRRQEAQENLNRSKRRQRRKTGSQTTGTEDPEGKREWGFNRGWVRILRLHAWHQGSTAGPCKLPGKPFPVFDCQVPRIQMMSNLMHPHVARVKPMQGDQLGPPERAGVKEHTTIPVTPITSRGTPPAFQLFDRSGHNKDRPQSFQNPGRAVGQLGLNFTSRTRFYKAGQGRKPGDFWEIRSFGNPAIKALKNGLNLKPPRLILRPVGEPVLRTVIGART